MQDVSKGHGRTILFVSHNMGAVANLCQKCILLENGEISLEGKTQTVIKQYLNDNSSDVSPEILREQIKKIKADEVFQLIDIGVIQEQGNPFEYVESGKDLIINISFRIFQKISGLRLFIDLYSEDNFLIFRSFNDETSDGIPTFIPGMYFIPMHH